MENRIFKYAIGSGNIIELPSGYKILDIEFQGKDLMMWVLLCPETIRKYSVKFNIYPTGVTIPNNMEYIKTVYQGKYVWHIFKNH